MRFASSVSAAASCSRPPAAVAWPRWVCRPRRPPSWWRRSAIGCRGGGQRPAQRRPVGRGGRARGRPGRRWRRAVSATSMLPVNYAFHSAQMAPLPAAASSPRWRGCAPTAADPAGLLHRDRRARRRRMRSTPPTSAAMCASRCDFAAAIDAMAGDGFDVFLGDRPAPGARRRHRRERGAARRQPRPCSRRCAGASPNARPCCRICAGAYTAGCLPDWTAVQPGPGEVVSLPAIRGSASAIGSTVPRTAAPCGRSMARCTRCSARG